MQSVDQTQPISKETIQLKSSQLVDEVKRIIHEGNVRRVVVKQDERAIAEFPLAVGVVGTLLAAPLAALAALAALLNDYTIEVEREELTPVAVVASPEQPSEPIGAAILKPEQAAAQLAAEANTATAA